MTVEAGVTLESCRILKKPMLWIWFCQERRKGTPISGPIIKEKTLILVRKMGGSNEEFTVSEGG
jgi:hypothetical protein